MKKNKLVIFTVTFPYYGENFLFNELKVIKNYFDEIIIVPTSFKIANKQKRKFDLYHNVLVVNNFWNSKFKFKLSVRLLKALLLEAKELKFDLNHIKKYLYRALIGSKVHSYTNEHFESSETNYYFYSYWMNANALGVSLLDKRFGYRFCRAHGSDVYNENPKTGYNPYQKYILSNIDRVYCVSDNGKSYLQNIHKEKLSIVSKLGVKYISCNKIENKNNATYVIVSCSSIDENKRVCLIAKALSKLIHLDIEWHHFGSGSEFETVVKLADELGIKANFHGQVDNGLINDFYASNNVTTFVNASRSEGIPVSIMEAMAHGIPCIATDVGGTRELVNQDTGLLLSSLITPEDMARSIEELLKNDDLRLKLSENSSKLISEEFDFEKNYTNYAQMIINKL